MTELPKKNEQSDSESGESRLFQTRKNETAARLEATISTSDTQGEWKEGFDQDRENDPHPSDLNIPTVESFGIDFGDGQILTAKGVEKKPGDWLKTAETKIKETIQTVFYPNKGQEDAKMHYMEDFNAFYTTDLSKYQIDPFIIAALTRNEIEHRKAGIDDAIDDQVRQFGTVVTTLDSDKVSIGTEQMQIHHIKRLLDAKDENGNWLYPQLEPLRKEPQKQALKYGALLIGAYLQDVARRLERGDEPLPWYNRAHKEDVNKKIRELWNSTDPNKRLDALIRSYNPGDGQLHVDNVRKHLKIIETTVGKLFL